MPLVGASPIYRPPVAGEPIRLREDGHWSTRGLVGYWPMREMRGGMTTDYSPHGNHGTLVNGPTWVPGERGGAVSFTADSNHYIDVGLTMPPPPWTIVTRAMWDGVRYRAIAGWSGDSFRMSGDRRWQLRSSGTFFISPLYSVPADRWVKWAFCVPNTTTVTVYKNGTLLQTTEGVDVRGGDLDIATNNVSQEWGGQIASFGIYNRALSAAEISALFAAPDLPIWRPRRGISLALLGESSIIRPRGPRTLRMGPRTILSGVI